MLIMTLLEGLQWTHVITASVTIVTILLFRRLLRQRQIRKALEQRGKQKRNALNQPQSLLLSKKSMVSMDMQTKILSWTATEIREQIISGNIRCIEVMITYCLKCDSVNDKINALFEKHYDAALSDAEALDKKMEFMRDSNEMGKFRDWVATKPLLGIPISIKDVFEMKESDSTNGILYCCNKPCTEDGSVLQMIRNSGGIPFCKTSVPQLLLMAENWNRIIGDTVNPHDIHRSCGGSSGGEGALIGAGGSVLGVGGDIGGSLRIPAHFNGIMAYKPSTKRTMINGKIWCYTEDEDGKGRYTAKLGILPSVGPMARSVDDLVLFLKAMWSPKAFTLDPYSAPIPFRQHLFIQKTKPRLVIGYWTGDHWFESTQSVKRAITLCVDTLRDHYHYEIVPMKFDRGPKVLEMYLRYILAPGNMTKYVKALRGEELHPQFKRGQMYQSIPNMIKWMVINPILRMLGEERKAFLMERVAQKGGLQRIEELEHEMYEILKFRYEFWQWVDGYTSNSVKGEKTQNRIDVIVTPTCCYPALPLGFTKELSTTLTATFLQNVLDCAAGTVGPVTHVREDECYYDMGSLPEGQRDSMSRTLDDFLKGATGLPIGVQVFGRPFDDELVLRVMKEIETQLIQRQ